MCLSHGQVRSKVYLSELNFYLSQTIGHRVGTPRETNKRNSRKHSSGIFLVSCFRRIEMYQHLMLNL